MPMADLKQLEFYVLRYVPYVVRAEFINIGVLLLEPNANGFGFADARMTSDWRRVRCHEPQPEALPAARPKNEHAVIRAQMKDAFTQAGMWDLVMKQVSAARYTKQKGDSLLFDFGYVVSSEVKFFHAVPLKTNTTQAVNLAYRFPEVAACIFAETQASAQ